MLASICPLGERARRQHYPVTVTAYVLAATGAGAALGALLGGLGAVVLAGASDDPGLALAVVAASSAAGLVVDGIWRGRHLPGPRRQVNEDWLGAYRGWVYGAGFGAQLGVGVTTYVMVSAIYVVLAAAFVAGSAAAGALLGAVFGVWRALPILATADVRDPAALRRRMRGLQRGLRPAHRAVLATQALVALAATAVMVVG